MCVIYWLCRYVYNAYNIDYIYMSVHNYNKPLHYSKSIILRLAFSFTSIGLFSKDDPRAECVLRQLGASGGRIDSCVYIYNNNNDNNSEQPAGIAVYGMYRMECSNYNET